MKVERFAVRSCCQSTSMALKIGKPLSTDVLALLVSKGYTENKHFTKISMLYAENADLIVNGAFYSNVLQVRCKKKDCTNAITALEEIFTQME